MCPLHPNPHFWRGIIWVDTLPFCSRVVCAAAQTSFNDWLHKGRELSRGQYIGVSKKKLPAFFKPCIMYRKGIICTA